MTKKSFSANGNKNEKIYRDITTLQTFLAELVPPVEDSQETDTKKNSQPPSNPNSQGTRWRHWRWHHRPTQPTSPEMFTPSLSPTFKNMLPSANSTESAIWGDQLGHSTGVYKLAAWLLDCDIRDFQPEARWQISHCRPYMYRWLTLL